jgi:branched-chain amino acid transport system ATP-binding protein
LSLEEIYTLFPNLEQRRQSQGTKLSGGEQQMLAIARILRTGAKLLLLDECTEGLAPVIVQKIGEVIRTLRDRGFTVLMVEQNFRFASALADRFYVIEEGTVVEQFARSDIAARHEEIEKLLGL